MEKNELEAISQAAASISTAIDSLKEAQKKEQQRQQEEPKISKGAEQYIDYVTNPKNHLRGKDLPGNE